MALEDASGNAILGSVGRKRLCFALSGDDGRVRPGTIRTYPAQDATGVTAALIGYQRDLALPTLPARSAIAVAGLVRGDAIAITQSRWFVSRSGLTAMLGAPPLILNDFAAEAWGLCSATLSVQEVFGGAAAPVLQKPGTYLVLGITSGLGSRSSTGTRPVRSRCSRPKRGTAPSPRSTTNSPRSHPICLRAGDRYWPKKSSPHGG